MQQVAELFGGVREQFAGSPVDDDAVAAQQIEGIELTITESGSDLCGVDVEPLLAGCPDFNAQRIGCSAVDLVLVYLRVDRRDDHAVIACTADYGHIAVDHVLQDSLGSAVEGIAESAAACRRLPEGIAGLHRNCGEHVSQNRFFCRSAVEPDAMRTRG